MKKYLLVLVFIICCVSVHAQQNNLLPLKVSANGHYLQYENGTPFFWLGDTGWELFHRLTLPEIKQYLDNRQRKGFNVIQAVILSELDGMRSANQYGERPLVNMDPGKPNEKYFQLIDTVVAIAAKRKIIMALLPAWGDKVTLKYGGKGPVIFTPENGYEYGRFLGNRYKNYSNIVWILGGDRPPQDSTDDWKPVYAAIAKGLDEGAGKHTLKTFHPGGFIWESSPFLHNEKWLDFNMIQSGHAELDQPVWKSVLHDWNLKPIKPTLDGEPNYEDHPINPWNNWTPERGYFRDYDVRKQIYRSVFSGAAGVTYGHHSVWQFYNPKVEKLNFASGYWYDVLDRPGAFQAGYLKELILSRPSLNRIPDQSFIVSGQGGNNAEHIVAFRDANNSYIMIYLPVGKKIEINTSLLKAKKIKASWFNPRTGKTDSSFLINAGNVHSFTPPALGYKNDWVLILDKL